MLHVDFVTSRPVFEHFFLNAFIKIRVLSWLQIEQRIRFALKLKPLKFSSAVYFADGFDALLDSTVLMVGPLAFDIQLVWSLVPTADEMVRGLFAAVLNYQMMRLKTRPRGSYMGYITELVRYSIGIVNISSKSTTWN
jgi:hypothetical protein